jgi:hypothetical protein
MKIKTVNKILLVCFLVFSLWYSFGRDRLAVIEEQLFQNTSDETLLASWSWLNAQEQTPTLDAYKYLVAMRLAGNRAIRDVNGILKHDDDSMSNEESEQHDIPSTDEDRKRIKHFYAKLTADDIAEITQDNPDSFYPEAKTISDYLGLPIKPCTTEEYEQLKRELGLEELYTNGGAALLLAYEKEKQFSTEYNQRLLSILHQKDSPDDDDIFMTTLLTLLEARLPHRTFDDAETSQITTKYENKLIKNGVNKSDMSKYVRNIAMCAPNCVSVTGYVNVTDWARHDATLEKGKLLQVKFNDMLSQKPERALTPAIVETTIDGLEPHPVFGSMDRDCWENTLQVSQEDDSIIISSSGADENSLVIVARFPVQAIVKPSPDLSDKDADLEANDSSH